MNCELWCNMSNWIPWYNVLVMFYVREYDYAFQCNVLSCFAFLIELFPVYYIFEMIWYVDFTDGEIAMHLVWMRLSPFILMNTGDCILNFRMNSCIWVEVSAWRPRRIYSNNLFSMRIFFYNCSVGTFYFVATASYLSF